MRSFARLMVSIVTAGLAGAAVADGSASLLDQDFRRLASDEQINLAAEYNGKVLLIVNTASIFFIFARVEPRWVLAAWVANLLIMPTLDAANIAFNLLKSLGEGLTVGPMLIGAAAPVHILATSVTARGVVNMTAVAAVDAQGAVVQAEAAD